MNIRRFEPKSTPWRCQVAALNNNSNILTRHDPLNCKISIHSRPLSVFWEKIIIILVMYPFFSLTWQCFPWPQPVSPTLSALSISLKSTLAFDDTFAISNPPLTDRDTMFAIHTHQLSSEQNKYHLSRPGTINPISSSGVAAHLRCPQHA